MNKKVLIISGVGLAVGFIEAVVYYNIGKNKGQKEFSVQFPRGKELYMTLGTIAITAVITAAISEGLEKVLASGSSSKLAIAG